MAPECEVGVKLLVTGGAGFIGTNFVKKVLNGTYKNISKLVVLDALTYAGAISNFSKNELAGFEFHKGDIRDSGLVNKIVPNVDTIINFAAESHVDRSIQGSDTFVDTNVLGVNVLLNASLRHKVERYFQVSTDEVYGSIDSGSWDETCALHPNSPYSATKASADLLILAFNKTYGLNTVISRCSNNFGPYQHPEKLIPKLITSAIIGDDLPIYGDGLNIRDWLYVEDHCDALNGLLLNGQPGEIYNVGGGTELTNLEVVHSVLNHFPNSNSQIKYVQDRLGHDQRYSVAVTKISNLIDFRPSRSFENFISSTIKWYLDNESWWKSRK